MGIKLGSEFNSNVHLHGYATLVLTDVFFFKIKVAMGNEHREA